MPTPRFTQEHVQKQLDKQAREFQSYIIEALKLTFEATGSCIHIIKKDKHECAICGKFVDEK